MADDLLPLPPGFRSIKDVLDGDVKPGIFVNVCGIVKDFRPPTTTKKTDWKATVTLYDISTEHDYDGIDLNIFRPRDNIPSVNAGDVMLLFHVRVQVYGGFSLITNHQSVILVYSAEKIPKYSRPVPKVVEPARKALKAKAGKELLKVPTELENTYVSYFYNRIDKGSVPEPLEFELMVSQALNVKDKFSLLKDIQESKFCELVVRVCRDPFEQADRITIYVSDYTENADFFNYTPTGVQDLDHDTGDMYGYGVKRQNTDTSNNWVGPYGKMALQVTCWEPHATVIREHVAAGAWIRLRNVQIKVARDGSCLEGALRTEDRGIRNAERVNVDILDPRHKETVDSRLKDAYQRYREYKRRNKQEKSSKGPTGKRKRDEEEDSGDSSHPRSSKTSRRQHGRTEESEESTAEISASLRRHLASMQEKPPGKPAKLNSKERRQRKRDEAAKKAKQQEARHREDVLGLNPLIICESPPDRASVQVSSLLEPQHLFEKVGEQRIKLTLPFVNEKHCVNVRVVDFHPPTLEDFARPCKPRDLDYMSDNNDSDSNAESYDNSRGGWEWNFAVQLEDIKPRADEPSRVWVVVNNMDAQYLTNLDASDLREDKKTLTALRDKLFTLWGELEEQKHWIQGREAEARRRPPGQAPPPIDSDDDGAMRRQAMMKNAPKLANNKPFTCCVQQYGVKETEKDPLKADAGKGLRWQRTFGLCGTKISSS